MSVERPDAVPPSSVSEEPTIGLPPQAVAPPRLRQFGDYELLEELARGGMGVIYKACQLSANRVVALKLILAGELATEAEVRRFRQEAEAVANLDHPHIVPLYDIAEHQGQHYFSMKLAEGGSLATRKDDFRTDKKAAALIATAARAVHHAHQRGILHRDLKPANILLDADGRALVTDFGLAKRVDQPGLSQQHSGIVGTPSYMAPEQARGERGLTTAVDVYGLGAVLYELLTGQPPFEKGNVFDTLLLVMEQPPTTPRSLNRSINADLQTICMKCLEKDPKRRYGSAEALADDLERWLRGEPIRARPVGRLERAVKWARRRPSVAALVVVSVLALGALAGLGVGFTIELKNERDAARTAENNEREAKENERAAKEGEREQRRKTEEALDVNEHVLTGIRIGQAHAAVRDNAPVLGLSLLESCPEKTRFWEWYWTRRLCRGAPLTLHRDGVFIYAVFSPDGRRIATNNNVVVTLFDAQTGAEQWSRPGGYRSVVFSPDGGRVVAHVATAKGTTLQFWEAATGKEGLTIPADFPANDAPPVFSPDGQWLASGTASDNIITVWNARTGEKKFAVPGKAGALAQLAYTPDGGSLAVFDGEAVRFLDPLTGTEQRGKVPAKSNLADFSPDGHHLALLTELGAVRILDLDTGALLPWTPSETLGNVGLLKYSPDGQRLAVADFLNNSIRLFDTATGKVLGTLPFEPGGQLLSLAFSPDGQRLAVVNNITAAVEVWNVRDAAAGLTLRGFSDAVVDLAFAPGGRQLLTVANVAAPASFPGGGVLPRGVGQFGGIGGIGVQMGGYSGPGWELKRWDVDGGVAVKTLPGHTAGLSCSAFSPNADRVAVSGSDNTVRVWDTRTGRELLLVGLDGQVFDLAFGPRGDYLIVLVYEGEVSRFLILDATSGRQIRALEPKKYVAAMALSPDGRSLAGSVTSLLMTLERIQVWSVQTGEEKWHVALPPNRSVSAAALRQRRRPGLQR